jgi:hypothetical protein
MATKDKDSVVENAGRYGEELLSANWNPVVDLLEASGARGAIERRAPRPEWREEDVDDFLGRVYKAGN